MSDLLKQIEAYEKFLAELKTAEASGKPYHVERHESGRGWTNTQYTVECDKPVPRVVYDPPKPRKARVPRKAWVLYVAPYAVDPWGMAFADKEDAGTKFESVEMREVFRDEDGNELPSEREQALQAECDQLREFVEAVRMGQVRSWDACHGGHDDEYSTWKEMAIGYQAAATRALELADAQQVS